MFKKMYLGLMGLCLLPAAGGILHTLYQTLVQCQMEASGISVLNRFLIGAGLWLLFFIGVTRPVRSYILAHELSHLLAAWICGIPAGRLRVGASGGSVEVARSSMWIALAPYLIPLYSLLLILAHYLLQLWWDPALWRDWLPLALGLSWAFHFSFTLHALTLDQSDFGPYGKPGSYSIILSVNLFWLCLALFVMNPSGPREDAELLLHELRSAYVWAGRQLYQLFSHIKNAIFLG